MKRLRKAIYISVVLLFPGIEVFAADGILLDCDRYDGEQQFKIYINEEEKYIIYNAQNFDSYEREREVPLSDAQNDTTVIDFGLDISVNNANFIMANDESASFVFIKRDATFAYSWTYPIPISEGIFLAFGNHHEGKCSINPFNQG